MDYEPAEYVKKGASSTDSNKPDLVILNQPISSFDWFERVWKHSRYHLCADGGANRLHDMFGASAEAQARRNEFVRTSTYYTPKCAYADKRQLPSIIHGDLDSLDDDIRDYYSAQGVEISRDPDQYSTDFGKAMQKIMTLPTPSERHTVLILGTLGGRVDQGLGLLHEMLREQQKRPSLKLWLFSEASVSFILSKGRSRIHVPLSESYFTPNIGILPIYGPAVISTTGLEWDVQNWPTSMGGQVSTSNHIVQDLVEVETNTEVLFTLERTQRLPE